MIPTTRIADIVLFRSTDMVAKLIRRFQTTPKDGRQPSWFEHVGQMSMNNTVLEAKSRVVLTPLKTYLDDPNKQLLIVRRKDLIVNELAAIDNYGRAQLGKKYGWWKIGLHLFDYQLSKLFRQDVYLFRRMCFNNKYPICSWVTAFSFKEVGIGFGVPAEECQPDDIGDTVLRDWSKWSVVYCHPQLYPQLLTYNPNLPNQLIYA